MLKALLKKQFLELNTFYFQDKKTGKIRSKGGIAGMVILFIFVFASIGSMFFGVGKMLAAPMIAAGADWLYFTLLGVMSIFLGVFGGVFNTYAGLYHANDNDLLLSMPIPPSKVLFARLTGVYFMGLLYEALVFIPSVIVYWTEAAVTPLKVIFPILMLFMIGFIVMSLTCALGWVVAMVSAKMKNKSFFTVLFSLIFFGLYYVVCFKIYGIIQTLVENIEIVSQKVRNALYPFYLMGCACTGKVLPMLIFTAITAAVTLITCFILSRTFVKIATSKTNEKKAEYKEKKAKTSSIGRALMRKELKRFTSSPTYMLNSGLGIALLPIVSVLVVVKSDIINRTIASVALTAPFSSEFFAIMFTAAIGFILSMNMITAPSISLEGRSIWIAQSIPVEPSVILQSKRKFHLIMNVPVACVAVAAFGFVLRVDVSVFLTMLIYAVASVDFIASLGLMLNLKKPNLTWTNEVVPIKQGTSIIFTMFIGFLSNIIFVAFGAALYGIIGVMFSILAFDIILIVVTSLMKKWLKTKGSEIFASL